jgi:hypothetical protein
MNDPVQLPGAAVNGLPPAGDGTAVFRRDKKKDRPWKL